jgi:8-oxo-dGTP diphosphatase
MINYVAGLLFSPSGEHVLLIRKNRPEWQRGKLNGIGGHIEDGEAPLAAMIREFKEETGMTVKNWKHFCNLVGKDWQVEWFKSFDDLADMLTLSAIHDLPGKEAHGFNRGRNCRAL